MLRHGSGVPKSRATPVKVPSDVRLASNWLPVPEVSSVPSASSLPACQSQPLDLRRELIGGPRGAQAHGQFAGDGGAITATLTSMNTANTRVRNRRMASSWEPIVPLGAGPRQTSGHRVAPLPICRAGQISWVVSRAPAMTVHFN